MTFSYEFLRIQRDYEYQVIKSYLPSRVRLLEIGAGSGYQARRFLLDGFDVSAIDLKTSNYAGVREFDVIDYDGSHIPFSNEQFDVVFSSSVLEHVDDLSKLHMEIVRVLKRKGIIVHILPSSSWRFWTLISGYLIGVAKTIFLLKSITASLIQNKNVCYESVKSEWNYIVRDFLFPMPHGERGNAFSEIWYFSRFYWENNFRSTGFEVKSHQPSGLFYTGNMMLASSLSLKNRAFIAKVLGSACHIYVLSPIQKDGVDKSSISHI